jgi:hypothetical protein
VKSLPLERHGEAPAGGERANGRMGRMDTKRETKRVPFGPAGRELRPIEDNNESEEE